MIHRKDWTVILVLFYVLASAGATSLMALGFGHVTSPWRGIGVATPRWATNDLVRPESQDAMDNSKDPTFLTWGNKVFLRVERQTGHLYPLNRSNTNSFDCTFTPHFLNFINKIANYCQPTSGSFVAKSPMEAHKQEVDSIARSVQAFYDRKERFRIYHGSTNSTRGRTGLTLNIVDTSRLKNVITVDVGRQVAILEANVSMDRLLEETLKHNMVPLVVTEFPGITVGGAFSGTAGESSSFKHGFFDRTVSEVEMVLANGDVVRCSKDTHADLFTSATGALGTLGVVTLLHVRLQKAAKYVEATYHAVTCFRAAVEMLQNVVNKREDEFDFLDGIMFSETQGTIVTGRLTNDKVNGLKVQRFSSAKDPWFFMHVKKETRSTKNPYKVLIPLPDYIFRYNRGCFWCAKTVFDLTGLPFNEFMSRALNNLFVTRTLYKALHAQEPTTLLVIQDLALPFQAAEDFIDWSADRLGIWPLWLCPLRVNSMPTLHPHPLQSSNTAKEPSELMLNIGVYGVSPRNYEEWITANRDVEEKVTELGGMKWAYAAQLYPEGKFWEQYDCSWYDKIREKYHASSLPTIYDKTKVDVKAGRSMVIKAIERRNKSWFGPFSDFASSMSCIWEAIQSKAWKEERSTAWKDWPN